MTKNFKNFDFEVKQLKNTAVFILSILEPEVHTGKRIIPSDEYTLLFLVKELTFTLPIFE